MTPKDVLKALIETRGALVCSADCSEMELAFARVEGRMFVTEDGIGFVLRTPEWLANADAALLDIRIEKANGKDDT